MSTLLRGMAACAFAAVVGACAVSPPGSSTGVWHGVRNDTGNPVVLHIAGRDANATLSITAHSSARVPDTIRFGIVESVTLFTESCRVLLVGTYRLDATGDTVESPPTQTAWDEGGTWIVDENGARESEDQPGIWPDAQPTTDCADVALPGSATPTEPAGAGSTPGFDIGIVGPAYAVITVAFDDALAGSAFGRRALGLPAHTCADIPIAAWAMHQAVENLRRQAWHPAIADEIEALADAVESVSVSLSRGGETDAECNDTAWAAREAWTLDVRPKVEAIRSELGLPGVDADALRL